MNKERFSILNKDDFERNGKWLLARRSLEVESFGMNIVELKPGEKIPEHDEIDRNQEEVFIVLEGSPTMIIDGEEYPVKVGTYIRLDPEPKRYAINNGEELAALLIISAPKTSGYSPLEWA